MTMNLQPSSVQMFFEEQYILNILCLNNLACCYKVLQGVDSQTEDVIIMAHVETLSILLPVVYNPYGSYVVNYFSSLGVEQVAPAIVASVAENKTTDGMNNDM